MRHIFEKNMRILNNLLTYFHEIGGQSFHVDFQPDEVKSRLLVRVKLPYLNPKTLEELRETMQIPRQRNVEENYWYLGGESEMGSNLTLIAMMTDCAQFVYQDGELTMELLREE